MRVLYGIQCTGNGHITRSIDLIHELKKYVQVDILTSGAHSEIKLPFEVKYAKKGLAYYFGKNGSFDLTRTLKEINPIRFMNEINSVPTYLYDMVISDFEPITAWSAKKNWVYSVSLSNQATLLKKELSKPKVVSPFSKLIIHNFCPTVKNYGFSYQKYDQNTFYPPIRSEIRQLNPTQGNYYLVYLPFYGHKLILKHLAKFKNEKWIVFSKYAHKIEVFDNVTIKPISNKSFIDCLKHCKGILCSAGFGTTSEALYLNKKLLVIPMKNQYEQQCNTHLLKQLGIPSIKSLKKKHYSKIEDWLSNDNLPNINFKDEKSILIRKILEEYISYNTIQVE